MTELSENNEQTWILMNYHLHGWVAMVQYALSREDIHKIWKRINSKSYSGMWFEWLIYRQEAVLWEKNEFTTKHEIWMQFKWDISSKESNW